MTPYYERDNVSLYSGDALYLLREMPSASVDAVITDPPYSSGGAFRGDRAMPTSSKYVGDGMKRLDFSGDNRDQRSYKYWSTLWLGECLRIAKPGAPLCVFSDWRQLPVTSDAIQAGGWVWRGIVPWNKTEAVRPQRGRFRHQCEYILWGSSGPMPTNRHVPVLPGLYESVVRTADKHHQAGKPTKVMQQIIRICEPDGVVLDPFCGSGTTCVAARLEKRKAIGIEQNLEFLRIAADRLDRECNQLELSLGVS